MKRMKQDLQGQVFRPKGKKARIGVSLLLAAALGLGALPFGAGFTASAAPQGTGGQHMGQTEEGGYAEKPDAIQPQSVDGETPESDFTWSIVGDEARVEGYTGSDSDVVVPAAYQGKPVREISTRAFANNTTIRSVTLPDGITMIEGSAFQGCTSLASVTIPDSVESIGFMAFAGCEALRSVSIRGVTWLGDYVFRQCSSLERVDMPTSIEAIPKYAFQLCEKLESIVIPEGVKSIGETAFEGCGSLRSVALPDSVTTIGMAAFALCDSLVSVKLPDGLEEIPDQIFDGCSSLGSIEIPDSVLSIGGRAFFGSALTSIQIPDRVTQIGNLAFMNCVALESMELPGSIKSIGGYAFHSCRKLRAIVIPDGVISIGENAFLLCDGLSERTVEIPQSVQTVGAGAFREASLTSVLYPEGLDLSAAAIETGAGKVGYRVDGEGNVVVSHIEQNSLKQPVVVPDRITGKPVLAVEPELRGMVSENGHTHRGGVTTCIAPAQCVICNAGYGDPGTAEHLYGEASGNGDGTHSRGCTLCGDTRTEACVYEYTTVESTAHGHTGTCELCGHPDGTKGHAYGEWTKESNTHYTNSCPVCGYEAFVALTAPPDAVTVEYGKTGELVLEVGIGQGMEIRCQWSLEGEDIGGATAAGLILPADLGLGTYAYQCVVTPEDGGENSRFPVAVKVVAADLGRAEIMPVDPDETIVYDGGEKKPGFTVELDGRRLEEGKDYTVSYTDNVNAGTAALTVTGKGSYTNSITREYRIAPAVPLILWERDVWEAEYTAGEPKMPALTVTLAGGEVFDGEIEYYYAQAGSDRFASGLPVEPGSYTVKACTAAEGNYAAAESKGLALTITEPGCGHEWQEKVVKLPTVYEEGIMRYTCTKCGEFYEESIAKLPGGGGSTPPPGGVVTPTPGEEATPTPGGEATPTPGEEVTPTPGGEATPTPGEEAMPTPGGEATPTPEGEATPTPGGEVTPTPGGEATPTPEGEATPTPEGEATPTPGGEATPTPGGEVTPIPGDEVTPAPETSPDEEKPITQEKPGVAEGNPGKEDDSQTVLPDTGVLWDDRQFLLAGSIVFLAGVAIILCYRKRKSIGKKQ